MSTQDREARAFRQTSAFLVNGTGLSIENDTNERGGALLEIPPQFRVAETDGWLVSHRTNSTLPGYLIVGSKTFANDLSALTENTLRELGPLLALTQDALKHQLNAQHVYIGRYGHVPGNTVHFHVIPIYDWVEELFWYDNRYRALERFAEGQGETATDGAELTLFVWHEFCERADPPSIKGPSISEAIAVLRKAIQLSPPASG